jgi:hypothetical protein
LSSAIDGANLSANPDHPRHPQSQSNLLLVQEFDSSKSTLDGRFMDYSNVDLDVPQLMI